MIPREKFDQRASLEWPGPVPSIGMRGEENRLIAGKLEQRRPVDVEKVDDLTQARLDAGIDLIRRQTNEMGRQAAKPMPHSLCCGLHAPPSRQPLSFSNLDRIAETDESPYFVMPGPHPVARSLLQSNRLNRTLNVAFSGATRSPWDSEIHTHPVQNSCSRRPSHEMR